MHPTTLFDLYATERERELANALRAAEHRPPRRPRPPGRPRRWLATKLRGLADRLAEPAHGRPSPA
ncbi:MAG: hypothetical protein JJT89_08955 [Nitriliruptoraceae bacterium]|nr:hypothetical protein [Nitriliruptoraceae bacterium]